MAAVWILNRMFGWSDYLGDMDNLRFLEQTVKKNLLPAALLYVGLTIISCVALALPGVTFAILAGVLFGPVLGTVLCSAATTIGAMIAFLVGRYFLKDSIKPVVQKNKYLKRWLFDESGKNDLFVLMITRLVPLFPYNLQNFAYGVTDILFAKYAVYSFLFMLPGTAMYTIGSAGIADAENRILYIGIAVLLAAAVLTAAAFFRKKYVQAEPEGQADGTQ